MTWFGGGGVRGKGWGTVGEGLRRGRGGGWGGGWGGVGEGLGRAWLFS